MEKWDPKKTSIGKKKKKISANHLWTTELPFNQERRLQQPYLVWFNQEFPAQIQAEGHRGYVSQL